VVIAMIADKIIDDLRQAGVTISADNGELRIDAPDGVLTAGRQAALKGHKAEILAFLQNDDDPLKGALTTAAAGLPVDTAELYEALALEDIAAWQSGDIGAEHLLAFAVALDDANERKAGRIPSPTRTSPPAAIAGLCGYLPTAKLRAVSGAITAPMTCRSPGRMRSPAAPVGIFAVAIIRIWAPALLASRRITRPGRCGIPIDMPAADGCPI
jgi:hypothetical protein